LRYEHTEDDAINLTAAGADATIAGIQVARGDRERRKTRCVQTIHSHSLYKKARANTQLTLKI